MKLKVKLSEDQLRPRLDIYLTEKIKSVNRAFISKLIEQDKVHVNGQKQKAGHKLKDGDNIEIDFDFKAADTIPEIKLEILYEDDDCLVINKPVGVLSHSKGAFNPEATVASFAEPYLKDMDGDRAGIVHRLDRATSGVIIVAKTSEALSWLQKQFSERKVNKTYYAVVKGEVDPEEAVIDIPIGRNPHDPKTFRVANDGKPATTQYKVEGAGNGYTLLKLMPQTGRTHQLRVHLKHLGRPIVGDNVYEGDSHDRLLLHAESLELTLPNRQRKTFSAPLPKEFQAILSAWV